jgi:arylsulfatase A-like enzyme
MITGRRAAIVAATLAGVLAIGGYLFSQYWYYLPGLMQSIRDPIEPNRTITWQAGPQSATLSADRRPPNVILILADDMGYNDITLNGGGVAGGAVPTPNIDSIARDGVRFLNGYAGNATCAPSRAALMTGRYATRFGFEFTPAPVAFEKLIGRFYNSGLRKAIYHADLEGAVPPLAELAVPTSEITIAQLLQTRGYHTMFLGKWHLGETPKASPNARGFDESIGFLAGASLYMRKHDPDAVNSYQDFDPIDKFLWANLSFAVNNNGGHRFYPTEYMTDYLGDEAVKAIAANRNRPFFMYLAFNAPHTPLQALKSDYDALPAIKDHRLRVYAAMIRALDRNVGHVLDALKANGLDQNTLVIFTSDNGGANYIGLPDINRPYRGWKATFFEGGIHVPYFMRWPAKIHAGGAYSLPVAHVDVFATAAAAANARLPTDRIIDGVDILAAMDGHSNAAPHRTLYLRSGAYKTLMKGDWKLQVDDKPDKKWLFNLKDDPTEQHNLADASADRVRELMADLEQEDRAQAKPLWPSLLEGPIAIDHPLSFPDSPNDEYIYWSN